MTKLDKNGAKKQPISQVEPISISKHLDTLRQREFIYQRESHAFAGTREFTFKHALLHEVTYESVLKSERRHYHRQTAEWLIENSGQRVEEYAGLIGGHFEQAGQASTAAGWFCRAGKQAQETYVADSAISHYRRALALFDKSRKEVPAPNKTPVYFGLGTLLREKAQFNEALEYFQLMLDTAETSAISSTRYTPSTASLVSRNGWAITRPPSPVPNRWPPVSKKWTTPNPSSEFEPSFAGAGFFIAWAKPTRPSNWPVRVSS